MPRHRRVREVLESDVDQTENILQNKLDELEERMTNIETQQAQRGACNSSNRRQRAVVLQYRSSGS